MRELPNGWTRAPVRDVLAVVRGISFPSGAKGPDSDGRIACLRTKNVQEAVDWNDLIFVPTIYVKNPDQYARPGDILISTANSYELVGKVAFIESTPRPATIGAFISILRPTRGVDPKFVYFQLAAPTMRKAIRATASTTTNISNISLSKCLDLDFLLPSLTEQRRIVAEIEKQFTRLEEAALLSAQLLRRIQALRTGLLKGMTTGHPNRRLDTLLNEPLANGRSVPTAEAGQAFFEVLRLTAVRDGHIDLSQSKHGAWSEVDARPFTVREGDFLIVRGNGSRKLVGRAGVVGKVTKAVAYPDTLIRARLDGELVHLPFLTAIWDSAVVREQIEKTARTTAGIYKINQKDLGELLIPMPDFETQRALFATWSVNDSTLSQLELCANQTNSRIARLRQAILAKAFSGQLVPQDSNDEPASVILDRIRAERGRAGNTRAKSRRTRSRMPEPALQST